MPSIHVRYVGSRPHVREFRVEGRCGRRTLQGEVSATPSVKCSGMIVSRSGLTFFRTSFTICFLGLRSHGSESLPRAHGLGLGFKFQSPGSVVHAELLRQRHTVLDG
eukprot:611071-Rhodomonas_salina.3